MNLHPVCSSEMQSPFCVGVFSDHSLTCGQGSSVFATVQSFLEKRALNEGEGAWITPEIYLLALGKKPLSPLDWQKKGGYFFLSLSARESMTLVIDALSQEQARALIYGFRLRSWRFETYHTSFRPLPRVRCLDTVFFTPHEKALAPELLEDQAIIESVHWSTHLINEPGNSITPATFIDRLQELRSFGIEMHVLDSEELKRQNFGALMGVAQGSIHPPYVVTLAWNGGPSGTPPIAFVGKGVTFDSGGLSLKPSSGMEEMKMDKAGACTAAGLIRALALRKAKVNAVAVLALVENMPSGSAQRPGDIVTSLSGQTIEVLNTDAEGRLILADALTYAQKQFLPSQIFVLATLTGAVRVALGTAFAGLFSNQDALIKEMIQAGQVTGERVWHLPLDESYNEALNSDCADMKNIAGGQVGAGSSIGAQFVARFLLDPQTPWVHLDIAATAHVAKDTPLYAKGGYAFGLRLIDQWIRAYETPPAA